MGLTKDFEDALEIVEGITQEVYNETKGADIRSYILKRTGRLRCYIYCC